MQSLLTLLQTYETLIYILLGLVALVPLQKLVTAWVEWRKSTFGLEKEAALRRVAASATMLSLLGLIVLAQFVLVTFVAPLQPAVTDVDEKKGLNIMAMLGITPEATDEASVDIIEGDPAHSGSEGCKKDVLEWTYPKPNDVVSGLVELRGTVVFDNLGFYKYEYRAAGTTNWTAIAAGDQQRKDELLGGEWSTRQLINGDYELRIVAVDTDNNPFPACSIPITIVNETIE